MLPLTPPFTISYQCRFDSISTVRSNLILEGGRYLGPFLKTLITSRSSTILRSPVMTWPQVLYRNLDSLHSQEVGQLFRMPVSVLIEV